MSLLINRRNFLNCAGTGLSIAGVFSLTPFALAASNSKLTSTQLTENIHLITGAGSNVIVMIGEESVLMVDGGLAENSSSLLNYIDSLSGGLPISTLFNTHWHWNHTGSNEDLSERGAKIIAHENTRLWLGADIISRAENRTYPARPKSALPTDTFFYDSKRINFEGETIEYGFMSQAHTDGDIYVLFKNSNILIAGDTITTDHYPFLDYSTGGWIGGLINAHQTLLSLCDEQTKVIPGTGTVQSKADVQIHLEMSQSVRESIANNYLAARNFDEYLADQPTQEFNARWGDPKAFLESAYLGANGHIRELGGIF